MATEIENDAKWLSGIKDRTVPADGVGKPIFLPESQRRLDVIVGHLLRLNDIVHPKTEPSIVGNSVNHPPHYGGANNAYEAIKVIEAWDVEFCLGNTLKYICRAGKKDDSLTVEDLKKAQWYLNRRIEQLEGK